MGTGFGMALSPVEEGVIPRAVAQIFSTIRERRTEAVERGELQPEFQVTAQFLEVSGLHWCNNRIALWTLPSSTMRRLLICLENKAES